MSNKVIAASLGIDYLPAEDTDEVEDSLEEPFSTDTENDTPSEIDPVAALIGPEQEHGHIEQDYDYTRKKMKSFLETGERGLNDLMDFIKDDSTARSYEVLSTMLGTVTDMATKFFDLQKKNKELHQNSLANISGKPDIAIRNGIVYAGDSASMLERLKEKKKQVQDE